MSKKNENAGSVSGVIYCVSFGSDTATFRNFELGEPVESDVFDGETFTPYGKLIHAVNAVADAVCQGVGADYRFLAEEKVTKAIKSEVRAGQGEPVEVSLNIADYRTKKAGKGNGDTAEVLAAE